MLKRTILSSLMLAGVTCTTHVYAANLLDIYQLAQQKDTTWLTAKANYQAALEKIPQARAALLPGLALGASASQTKNNNNTNQPGSGANGIQRSQGGTLALTQQLFHFDSWLNLGIAQKQEVAAKATLESAEQQLMLDTTGAYFKVLAAEDSLSYAKANTEFLQRQLEEAEQSFKVGLKAITDVKEARAERDQALATEIAAENSLQNSYEDLRVITGISQGHLDKLDTQRFAPERPRLGLQQWTNLAVDKNLSLNTARINKEVAKQQIRVAEAGHLPTLDLSASLKAGHTNNTQSNGADEVPVSNNSATVGLSLNIPLYSGGATSSKVREQEAMYVAASEALESAYRMTISGINTSYNNVNANISSIKALTQAVLSQQSSLDATKAGYEVGTRTIVDVLDQTTKLYDAKQKLSTARYQYINDILALKNQAGTLSQQDLKEINGVLKAR